MSTPHRPPTRVPPGPRAAELFGRILDEIGCPRQHTTLQNPLCGPDVPDRHFRVIPLDAPYHDDHSGRDPDDAPLFTGGT